MKINSTQAIDFHAGLLRGTRDRIKAVFGHASAAVAPVRADRSFWQKVGFFEVVDRDLVRRRLHDAIDAGDAGRVRHLLRHSLVDPNDGHEGWSPLRRAVEKGHHEVLRVLLDDARTVVSLSDGKRITPLHVAAERGDVPAVGMLVGHPRARPDLLDDKGRTAAGCAIDAGQRGVLRTLARSVHVDLDEVCCTHDGQRETIIERTLRLDQPALLNDMFDDVTAAKSKITARHLELARLAGAWDCLDWLLMRVAATPFPDREVALKALDTGIRLHRDNSVQHLLEEALWPEVRDPSRPFMAAVEAGDMPEVLRWLRTKRAEAASARTLQGMTPLTVAAIHSPPALALLLGFPGFDPAERDEGDCTALMHAIAAGQHESIAMLLGDPRTDLRGAMQVARRKDDMDVAQALANCWQDLADIAESLAAQDKENLVQRWQREEDPVVKRRMAISAQRWERAASAKASIEVLPEWWPDPLPPPPRP